ncbi:hypothetical protein HPB47_026547, partial [Ixodes persulcatus]
LTSMVTAQVTLEGLQHKAGTTVCRRRSKHFSGGPRSYTGYDLWSQIDGSAFYLARAFFARAIFLEWARGIHASGFPSPRLNAANVGAPWRGPIDEADRAARATPESRHLQVKRGPEGGREAKGSRAGEI